MQNADNKKIFKAYKYIKSRIVKKLSSIIHENYTCASFKNALYNAMYLKNSFLDNQIILNNYSEQNNQFKWFDIEESKIRDVIFILNLKKFCESDSINFLII